MNDYERRINRVINYIEEHLDEDLELDVLSGVALFSKYHFHRIFAACTGETLGACVTRLRLQRAAQLLKSSPHRKILDIALECGFSGAAVFSRSFKHYYGTTPADFRDKSNLRKEDGNTGEAGSTPEVYLSFTGRTPEWRSTMEKMEATVEIRELERKHLAYVRHTGSYRDDAVQIQGCWTKLMNWAGVHGFIKPGAMVIAIYHDDPEIVSPPNQRTSICVTIPEDIEESDRIGVMDLEGGRYGVGSFTLKPQEYQDAWNWMYGVWLPKSGLEPDERICFENYPAPPGSDGSCAVEIWIPVK